MPKSSLQRARVLVHCVLSDFPWSTARNERVGLIPAVLAADHPEVSVGMQALFQMTEMRGPSTLMLGDNVLCKFPADDNYDELTIRLIVIADKEVGTAS